MTETTIGREPLQIVELEQPQCGLIYGATPCTAEVGVTGTRKCFNTRATCQDKANYSPELSANLAVNPGFEDGDESWVKFGAGGAPAQWEILDDANAETGDWVARKQPGADNGMCTALDAVPCVEGEVFRTVLRAKASGTTDGTILPFVLWLDSAFAVISPSFDSPEALTAAYQTFDIEAAAPANAAYVAAGFTPGSVVATDTLYVDNAELRRVSAHGVVWRFIKPASRLPRDLFDDAGGMVKANPIPSLIGVSTSPTKINIGAGSDDASPLGRRASVNVTLQDHPWDDSVEDKYLAERDYNPLERGRFWAKWLARNPFHNQLLVRVLEGYVGQDLEEMQARLYVLDRINGPDASGRVSLTAKDPLRLADEKRALFPTATEAELQDARDASTTSGWVILVLEADLDADFGNTGSDRYLRIDNEIILYTGKTGADTTWTLTGVVRAQLGTTAATHAAGAHCQRVGRFEDIGAWLVAHDLLANHTPVPSDYIDLDQWEAEGDAYLQPFIITGTVAEPTPVMKLLGELTEQCLFYMWWDERAQTIPIKAIRPALTDGATAIDDTANIIAGSSILTEEPDQRLSRVFLYYNQKDPTEGLQDVANYSSVRARVDGAAESEEEHGEARWRQIFSRWLTTSPQAIQTTLRILARYRDSPRFLSFKLDAKDRAITTGDVLDVTTHTVVDDTGAEKTTKWQVISVDEVVPGEVVRFDTQSFEFYGRFWTWLASGAPDYDAATEAERAAGSWWADDDGLMPDGTIGYQWF